MLGIVEFQGVISGMLENHLYRIAGARFEGYGEGFGSTRNRSEVHLPVEGSISNLKPYRCRNAVEGQCL